MTMSARKAQAVLAQRELARRRLLHFTKFTHPSYDSGWVHEDICARLEKFSKDVVDRKSPRLMLLMPPRHGKLLADSTPVRTRDGWKTHGELRPGDYVIGSTGHWVRVSQVSGPGRADVEITLCTGEKFLAHENHEWTVLKTKAGVTNGSGYNGKFKILDTVETKEILAWCDAHGGSGRYMSRPDDWRFRINEAALENNRDIVFDIRRRLRPRLRAKSFRIVAARRVPPEEAQVGRCIQVDAPDGLYCVGRGFVLTHNSELASIRFPAWHLGHNPRHEIINVGYNLDLPIKFSRKVREVVKDANYTAMFPDTRLDPDVQSAESWNTTKGGGFTAAGVGGGITGKGAHILIIDDPLKNMEEADSIDRRDLLDEWYQSTAYTRLAPGGGVLFIECMTGDTPVLMADGTEKRMDEVRAGDNVATYKQGLLSAARVAAVKCSGRDKIQKITMSSGRILRANERHPFLATTNGELKWVRTRALNTANKIVTLPASGVSGKGSLAEQIAATSQLNAEGSAIRTTASRSVLTATNHQAIIQKAGGAHTSNSDMESPSKNTTDYALSKEGYAQSADFLPRPVGMEGSWSTIAMTPKSSEVYSATPATSESDILNLNPIHVPLPNTYAFTLDDVVSVEFDGEEDVFDLQIEGTENFIANYAVTHNTWWNDDDLAGRLQQRMANDPEADQFDVVKYPAISEKWEYRDKDSFVIVRSEKEIDLANPPLGYSRNLELLRPIDFCLHEARYPTEALKKIRANMNSPRIWSALYQQNPVPDEGMYFQKEYFKYQATMPSIGGFQLYTAWDFAIGEKQQNDYTVGVTLLQDNNDILYVMDVVRFRGDAMEIVEAILDTAQRWGSDPTTDYMLGVEDGQIWRAIEPLLKKRMDERRMFLPYEALKPLTDKLSRARPLQGRMQQKKVVFPQEATWLKDTEKELLRFPAGAHDDVVDALAWGVRLVINRPPKVRDTPQPLKSWKDQLVVESANFGEGHMAA